MMKSNNKGVSLVEVIVAIALFSLLIIPITLKLISSMEINTKSKEKQYVKDYAEYTMEYFKGYNFEGLPYLENADPMTDNPQTKQIVIGSNTYNYKEVTYTTKTNLGVKDHEYDVNITLSTLDYVLIQAGYKAEKKNGMYQYDGSGDLIKTPVSAVADPNQNNMGNVKSIDADVDVMITNASNYDITAQNAIYAAKVDKLRDDASSSTASQADIDHWKQFMAGKYQFDMNESVDKLTRIIIKKNLNGTYTVQCILEYKDQATDYVVSPLSYVIYAQDFVKKPDIYLMFNQCIYNNDFANDNLVIDNSDCKTEDIKMYMIGTYGDTNGGTASASEDASNTLSNKVYKILGETAYKSLVNEPVGSNGVIAGHAYDKETSTGKYAHIVNVNTTTNSLQSKIKLYVSDSTDTKYNLYGRIVTSNPISNVLTTGSNTPITSPSSMIYKLSDEERFSSTGVLYSISVNLDSSAEGAQDVTLYGTMGGN